MSTRFKIVISIVAVFLVLQFIPVEKPEVISNNQHDLIINNKIDTSIKDLIQNSCYDCHSNETVYPLYAYVAPVSWLVIRDTKLGREELNFSEWEDLSKIKKIKNLKKIADEIESNKMPMGIYTLIHRDAKLSEEEKTTLIKWTKEQSDLLIK